MGIAEILAAKKAKLAAEAMQQPAVVVHTEAETKPTAVEQNNPANPGAPLTDTKPSVGPTPVQPNTNIIPEPPKHPGYPTVDANGKPLSGFHLIQARKKVDSLFAIEEAAYKEKLAGIPADVFSAQSLKEEVKNVEQPQTTEGSKAIASPQSTSTVANDAKLESQSNVAAVVDTVQSTVQSTETPTSTPEAEQAYADLKTRIDSLVSMSEDNLKTAMQDLKRALMQNPSAVSLMLPSDIGQMVIALRKMTGVELEAAKSSATKAKTGKKKEAILSSEQLEAAWQEL